MEGKLEQQDGRWRLRFERRLAHPPEKVWLALTEPEHLAAWFPTDIQGDRVAGAPLRFEHRDGAGPPMDGEMIVYDPPSVLEFRWGDDDTLRFEVQRDGEGSVLTLVDTFDEIGKAARDAAGWHACLDVLGYHLDDREPPWNPVERWAQVHETYVEGFGPNASTIGPPEWSSAHPG